MPHRHQPKRKAVRAKIAIKRVEAARKRRKAKAKRLAKAEDQK